MDPAGTTLEEKYSRYIRDLTLSRTRLYAVVGMVLVPLFSFLDFLTQPEAALYFLWIRVIASAALMLVFLATRTASGKRLYFLLPLAGLSLTSLGIEAMVVRLGAHSSPYYAGLCLVNLAAGLLLPWNFTTMVGFSLFQLLSYIVPAQFQAGPFHWQLYVNNLYFLFSTAAISCWASYFNAENRRREFRLRSDIEEKSEALKKASKQLEESLRRVQEFDRLKSQFFANMSHELRTPLTLMLPPLEDLSANPRYALSAEVKGLLDVMARNGKSLLKLINELLDLSKLEAGKFELRRYRSNLGRLLGEVASRFKPFAEKKGLSLDVSVPADVPDSLFDVDRMEQVLGNLLSNAVKFTSPGGRVSARLAWDGEGQTVSVEDTGIGIRREDQERVFDRFSQADGTITRRFGGTGIGLSLAKELVQLHGGRIELRSELGKGSTFSVWIPRSSEAGDPAPDRPAAAAVADGGAETVETAGTPPDDKGGDRPTVLVIDDNADLRSLLKTILEPRFRVELAKDGEEGLLMARRTRPDVVVSDVMMPGKSGDDVARELKADPATSAIPLILLTAKLDAGSLVEGLAAGADDYVRKPFSPPELIARILGQLRIRALTQLLTERASRSLLASVSEGVAHEINNPLAVMGLNLDRMSRVLRAEPADPGEALKWLERTQEYVGRIARIVEGLCALSGDGTPGGGGVGIGRMVEDVVCVVRPMAQKSGVELSVGDIPEELWVRGNGPDLRQALLNLVINGIEAAHAGGTGKSVRVTARAEVGRMAVTVKDDGPGVPADLREKIFHPFFTTKPVGTGVGLGLSIARRIVEAHGGSLRLDAAAQGRTSFTMLLPLVS